MFKRQRWLGARACLLVLLAIIFMIGNECFPVMVKLRSDLSVLTLPFQYIVDLPIRFVQWGIVSFTNQQATLDENATLRARQLLLEAKLQRLLAIEQENTQLRQLLASASAHLKGKILIAQLLAVSMEPSLQQAVLDKGRASQIYQGQPVLDAYGAMGQVVEVGPYTSKVLLITDTRSAIPVQDNRSGVRAIATGLGLSNKLALIHVPSTSDIQVGDLVVTSGLGQGFPYGYPVGTVLSVDKATGDGFAQIILNPSAHLDRSRQVVLVWPDQDQYKDASEAQPVPVNDKKITDPTMNKKTDKYE